MFRVAPSASSLVREIPRSILRSRFSFVPSNIHASLVNRILREGCVYTLISVKPSSLLARSLSTDTRRNEEAKQVEWEEQQYKMEKGEFAEEVNLHTTSWLHMNWWGIFQRNGGLSEHASNISIDPDDGSAGDC